MIETRKKEINNIILKKEDLNILIIYLKNIYDNEFSQDGHINLSFDVKCYNDSVYRGDYSKEIDDFVDFFNIIDRKKIKNIQISYTNYRTNNNIIINFEVNKYKTNYNEFVVGGSEGSWVNDNFTKINEIIESTDKTNSFLVKYKKSCFIIIILLLTFLGLRIVLYYRGGYHLDDKKILAYFSFIFIYINSIIGFMFMYVVRKLYPVVEFDFGLEQYKKEKNTRRKLFNFIIYILLPIFYLLLQLFLSS
jgi:hypothetical protein